MFNIKSILKKMKASGFTLVELLVTIAIIGILASLAIPSYLGYTNKAKFSEVVTMVDSMKTYVASCVLTTGALTNCNNGSNGVPTALATPTTYVSTLTTTAGVITGTGTAAAGSFVDILTPTVSPAGVITWSNAGSASTCIAAGAC